MGGLWSKTNVFLCNKLDIREFLDLLFVYLQMVLCCLVPKLPVSWQPPCNNKSERRTATVFIKFINERRKTGPHKGEYKAMR